MKIRQNNKSTVEDIRQKFDNQVHRYDNLEVGQQSAMDSTLIMETVSYYAGTLHPNAKELLDIGCGAGNYTIKTLEYLTETNCTMVDLSSNMLQKAFERVSAVTPGKVDTIQGDIRELNLPENKFDIVLAATSLHHLREENEWESVFAKVYQSLKKGGVFIISDIVLHDQPVINEAAWKYYWDYLEKAGGEELKKWVYEQIDIEDSPRSLGFQTNLMRKCGFEFVEILYRKSVFAAFCGVK